MMPAITCRKRGGAAFALCQSPAGSWISPLAHPAPSRRRGKHRSASLGARTSPVVRALASPTTRSTGMGTWRPSQPPTGSLLIRRCRHRAGPWPTVVRLRCFDCQARRPARATTRSPGLRSVLSTVTPSLSVGGHRRLGCPQAAASLLSCHQTSPRSRSASRVASVRQLVRPPTPAQSSAAGVLARGWAASHVVLCERPGWSTGRTHRFHVERLRCKRGVCAPVTERCQRWPRHSGRLHPAADHAWTQPRQPCEHQRGRQ
jgi:hypothetical protein